MKKIVLIAVLAGSACFYPGERGQMLEERVDKLSTDNQELKRSLIDAQEKFAKAQKRLEDTLEQLDKAARRSDADIGIQMQKTVEDVAALRGQVETYQYKVAELESALKSAQDALTAKAASSDPDAATKKKADELKRPDDPKDFLRLADDTSRSDKGLARTLYNEFLKKWPKDTNAGEAHFGLGETYYTDDKCREALYEYGKVIQEFTKTRSAPDAYLRSADCFKKLKMTAESKLALETLMKEHPKSDAAKTAKVKLAELDEKPEKPAPKKGNKK
jgi:tol-pal system protein YbgF